MGCIHLAVDDLDGQKCAKFFSKRLRHRGLVQKSAQVTTPEYEVESFRQVLLCKPVKRNGSWRGPGFPFSKLSENRAGRNPARLHVRV